MENDDSTISTSVESIQLLANLPPRYVNKGVIGQGGMGAVFHAYDRQLTRDVAVKVLLFAGASDPDMQERFSREAKALAALDHPNIVKLLSWGLNDAGQPYNEMEYLEGVPLSNKIGGGKRLTATQFYEIFNQVLAGLSHAHEQKIVHRDLKPSNIIICQTPDGGAYPKIIDFGIARFQDPQSPSGQTLTKTTLLIGSPVYMSPEQCKGSRVDHRSDIYSLACVMYEALTGDTPQKGETPMELMYNHMSNPAKSLELTAQDPASKRLGRMIDRCLAKNPEERLQTAADMKRELSEIYQSPVHTGKLFATEQSKKQKQLYSFVGISLVAFAVMSSLLYFGYSKSLERRKQADKVVEQDKSHLKGRIDALNRSAKILEGQFSKSPNVEDKKRIAEPLFDRLLNLAIAQREAKETDDSIKTLRDALRLCPMLDREAQDHQAMVLLNYGLCKLDQNKVEEADQTFEKGLNCTTISRHGVIPEIGMHQAILRIRKHDFNSALYKVRDLIRKIEFLENFGGSHALSSNRLASNTNLVYEVAKALDKEAPATAQEQIDALELYNEIAGFLLDKKFERCDAVIERLSQLQRKIPSDNPQYKRLANMSYKIMAENAEAKRDFQQAKEYIKLCK